MRLEIADDADDLARRAFRLAEAKLVQCRDPLVVLPTGNTPLGLYAEAVRAGPTGLLARARFVQLDEYLGIARDDRRALRLWTKRIFLGPLAIKPDRLIAFDPATKGAATEASRVETEVAAVGISLALLGLGPNGHLGFNEPGSAFDSETRAVKLTPESIKSNAVYWGGEGEVPRRAFTLGLGTLAGARASILLVSGGHKAGILRRVLEEEPSPAVPATCLHQHRDVTVIADRAALADVPHALVRRYQGARTG